MLFMIIERFRDNDMVPIYERLRDEGRGLPQSLEFVGSWVEPGFGRAFQLMECSDATDLQKWVLHWRGTNAEFEIVPVLTGADTRKNVEPYLSKSDPKPSSR
jgi:hypothetical protein